MIINLTFFLLEFSLELISINYIKISFIYTIFLFISNTFYIKLEERIDVKKATKIKSILIVLSCFLLIITISFIIQSLLNALFIENLLSTFFLIIYVLVFPITFWISKIIKLCKLPQK
ncbi:MAG: hypothetical protein AUK33_03095 [Flavobacteriaceae bacterium CG2_30_34_30]|nr:MAG: hypothetical protein AUK33_03095 [Flavobacteriaceae bacterium CG2_30_34_30]PJC06600.1 MAG: hypothetical protein CO068_10395 [Flavobacteriaceae bacterium CG_4_9_14_0_8_um_filter_34_30]